MDISNFILNLPALASSTLSGECAGICSQIWNLLKDLSMQVIALRALKQFWRIHPQAEISLRTWYANASQAMWSTPQDIKNDYRAAVDFVSDNRAIFDIAGNKYRLIVHVSYRYKRILIKFVGTHREYDDIDPETVS
jgi:mRNA interferase HigB